MSELRVVHSGEVSHHTLYYRKVYERYRLTRAWRNHPLMIVPLPRAVHDELHRNVEPVMPAPSEILARMALDFCALHQNRFDTNIEAFTAVSEYLRDTYRQSSASALGREALRFSNQFDRQIAYINRGTAQKDLRP